MRMSLPESVFADMIAFLNRIGRVEHADGVAGARGALAHLLVGSSSPMIRAPTFGWSARQHERLAEGPR